MRRCVILDAESRIDLQDKINGLLKDIEEDGLISDIKFHYGMSSYLRSVLITYIKEEKK